MAAAGSSRMPTAPRSSTKVYSDNISGGLCRRAIDHRLETQRGLLLTQFARFSSALGLRRTLGEPLFMPMPLGIGAGGPPMCYAPRAADEREEASEYRRIPGGPAGDRDLCRAARASGRG